MNTKKLSLLALFIALSIIGAFIKIPAIIGSVALDVFPALIAAILIDKRSGALVAGIGHLVSALIGGMPLGPMHVIIAIEMAVIVWIFSIIYESGKRKIAGAVFVLLNGLIAPLPFILVLSGSFYIAIVPSLLIGSLVNTILALILIHRFEPMLRAQIAKVLE